jgi:hypothetical protein
LLRAKGLAQDLASARSMSMQGRVVLLKPSLSSETALLWDKQFDNKDNAKSASLS